MVTHHSSCMKSVRQRNKIGCSTKIGVHLVDVLCPITMIRLAITGILEKILHDGGDPYLIIVSNDTFTKLVLRFPCQNETISSILVISRTHGSKSHILDIIQMTDKSLPCSTAIIVQIAGCSCRPISSGKAIGHHLVDGLSSPLSWCQSFNQSSD